MSDDGDGDTFDVKDFEKIHQEIKSYKQNPETAGMFVSGWDDDDNDIEVAKNPEANPVDHVLWAAENGKIDTLKELLAAEPNLIDVKDSNGYSLLHRAAYNNHLSVICYLLSVGAKVNAKTELGWTPLHSACNWNNYSVVARLLAGGADPSEVSEGDQTPLHLASAISHCKSTLLILLLRDDSVEIAQKLNKAGETPEHLARGKGIYGPLFEMVLPAASYIRSLAFTCNPYVRQHLH